MIIEFCGLPGCGKTTLMNDIINKVNAYFPDVKIYTRDNTIYRHRILRKIDSILFETCAFGSRKVMLEEIGQFSREYTSSRKKYEYRLLEMMETIRQHKQDNLFLDEGLLQYITSLPFDQPIRNDAVIKPLLRFLSEEQIDYRIVICNITKEEAVRRIGGRNRDKDRYNISDEKELERLLDMKQKNLERVLKVYSPAPERVISIDMQSDIHYNADIILQNIAKYIS